MYIAALNTLANHSGGNENATAEHQMLSGQFQKIHVNNPITDTIYERLTRDRTNVVLTGNAGDGKTTIAIDIFRKLESAVRPLQPIERVHSAGLVIIKDMSELSREEQEKVLTEARDSTDFVYLIVSNTGTFLESFKRVFQGDNAESTLLNALKADSPQSIFDDRFFVINLGRIDSIATACKVLRRMVDERNWAKCLQCNDPWSCPLYINVQLIRERQDVFFERLELLYRRLFEYGNKVDHASYDRPPGLCTLRGLSAGKSEERIHWTPKTVSTNNSFSTGFRRRRSKTGRRCITALCHSQSQEVGLRLSLIRSLKASMAKVSTPSEKIVRIG